MYHVFHWAFLKSRGRCKTSISIYMERTLSCVLIQYVIPEAFFLMSTLTGDGRYSAVDSRFEGDGGKYCIM